ncbi:hypothetical protein LZ32DRAFT_445415 [Colletotrichum eremochloae]|nr:hypothetical protein LZ32DRAFT_445415 [Colletotrichum eremochloae]
MLMPLPDMTDYVRTLKRGLSLAIKSALYYLLPYLLRWLLIVNAKSPLFPRKNTVQRRAFAQDGPKTAAVDPTRNRPSDMQPVSARHCGV